MNTDYAITKLSQNFLPVSRTDLDVTNIAFDTTGVYGSFLTMLDCDGNNDEISTLLQVLPTV